jgi:hypothetical protein
MNEAINIGSFLLTLGRGIFMHLPYTRTVPSSN